MKDKFKLIRQKGSKTTIQDRINKFKEFLGEHITDKSRFISDEYF